MFSDHKTLISKFTLNTRVSSQDDILEEANKSRILRKNLSAVVRLDEKKDRETLDKSEKKILSKETLHKARQVVPDVPVEKKLKMDDIVTEVVSRRANRGAIQSTDQLDSSKKPTDVIQAIDDQEDLGLKVKRYAQSTQAESQPVQINLDQAQNEEQSEAEEEYEEEEDSESEEIINLIKRPVFIQKEDRFVTEKDLQEEFQKKLQEKKAKEIIREQNKQIVIEAKSKREENLTKNTFDSDDELPNDEDDDPEEAYQLWKIRELGRLRRDRDERDREFLEKERTERRRMMTDEERAKDDKRIGKYKTTEKSSLQFMQKFYHTGIFGDRNDPLFQRDYNIGVGSDNFDKSNLPKALQVRRGQEHKKGRSKYTHLGDQDTTLFEKDFIAHETLSNKFMSKMGGYKSSNVFDRPTKGKM